MQKIEQNMQHEVLESSGLVRVALYRDPIWDASAEVGLHSWGDAFYDFSKSLRVLSSPALVEGQYDDGFFFVNDRFKNY